jgi:hypothetical protein
MPVQQTPANAQVDSLDGITKLRSCLFSVIVSTHCVARQVAVFGKSTPAMQRVLKFPCWRRRLNASSQLKGIFSVRPSRGSCPFFLPEVSAADAGTTLHLSWNEVRASEFSVWI